MQAPIICTQPGVFMHEGPEKPCSGGGMVPQNTSKREPSVVGPLRINPKQQVE